MEGKGKRMMWKGERDRRSQAEETRTLKVKDCSRWLAPFPWQAAASRCIACVLRDG